MFNNQEQTKCIQVGAYVLSDSREWRLLMEHFSFGCSHASSLEHLCEQGTLSESDTLSGFILYIKKIFNRKLNSLLQDSNT